LLALAFDFLLETFVINFEFTFGFNLVGVFIQKRTLFRLIREIAILLDEHMEPKRTYFFFFVGDWLFITQIFYCFAFTSSFSFPFASKNNYLFSYPVCSPPSSAIL